MSGLGERAEATVGIVVNPVSGRDARRLYARAGTYTHEQKRGDVERAIVGAVASGARRVVVTRDLFRISESVVDTLRLDAALDVLDLGFQCKADDTRLATEAMRKEGCAVLIVLGGDGTNRMVAKTWPDAPVIPLSTGTNNVFPLMVEATLAGAAAGLIASGEIELDAVTRRAKVVRVEIDGEAPDVALVDAVHLVDDKLGNAMPFDTKCLRRVVLSRAEPSSVGMSPVGGLLLRADAEDEFGVEVECVADGAADGECVPRTLLAPISPGLYRTVHVRSVRRLELGEPVDVVGPGLLAFDGDRERQLALGQRARLRVVRDGPRVIEVARALSLAAQQGVYTDRAHWHDPRDEEGGGASCC